MALPDSQNRHVKHVMDTAIMHSAAKRRIRTYRYAGRGKKPDMMFGFFVYAPPFFCAAQNRIGGKCIYLFTQQTHEYGKKTSHCTLSLDTRHQCFRPIALGQLGRHARSGRKQTAPCIQFRQGRKRQHHMQHGQPRPGGQGHSGQRKHRGQRGDNRQYSGTRSDIRSHHEKRPYHGHIQAVGLQFRPDAAPRQERGAPAAKPAASVSIHDRRGLVYQP